MEYTSKAIALTYLKHSETSIVAKLYTEKKGLQTFFVKGVRSKKSKNKLGLFQPLQFSVINSTLSKKRNLQRLNEINLAEGVSLLSTNMNNQLLFLFIAEVLSKILHDNKEDEELFRYIWSVKISLSQKGGAHNTFPLIFLLDLSKFLGFYPLIEKSPKKYFDLQQAVFVTQKNSLCLSSQNSYFLKLLLKGLTCEIPKKSRKEMLSSLILYYKLHNHELKNITSHIIISEL